MSLPDTKEQRVKAVKFNIPKVDCVSRERWGALPPHFVEPLPMPARHVYTTYTGTRECFTREDCIQVIKEIQRRDMESGLPDLRYNFLMGGDVALYEGRGWTTMVRKPEKCYSESNGKTIDFAYIGPHPKPYTKNYPTIDVHLMSDEVIEYGIENGYIDSFYEFPEGNEMMRMIERGIHLHRS